MILDQYHSTHFGYHRLYDSIKDNFANISQISCRDFCLNCPVCARYTVTPKEPHITPILSTKPHEHLVIDLKDFKHLVDDNDNFRYALTIVDHFSGYPWVYLLKHKTAAEVHAKLLELFREVGPRDSTIRQWWRVHW